jgi:hypothetical protein
LKVVYMKFLKCLLFLLNCKKKISKIVRGSNSLMLLSGSINQLYLYFKNQLIFRVLIIRCLGYSIVTRVSLFWFERWICLLLFIEYVCDYYLFSSLYSAVSSFIASNEHINISIIITITELMQKISPVN